MSQKIVDIINDIVNYKENLEFSKFSLQPVDKVVNGLFFCLTYLPKYGIIFIYE